MDKKMPDWAVEGAEVFASGYVHIRKTKIVRVTKTTVTCDNKTTYRLSNYDSKLTHKQSSYETVTLYPLSDDQVAAKYNALMKGRWEHEVAVRAEQFRQNPSDETVTNLEAGIAAWRRVAAAVG